MKEVFHQHQGYTVFKWEHYLDAYEHEIGHLKGKCVNVLEIGVARGGSLHLLSKYFGKLATVHGIDINKNCKNYEAERIFVHIGSQADAKFLDGVCAEHGPFDVIIDDGSHMVDHQIFSLEHLWTHLKPQGIYVCEDTHTSYFSRFGGGLDNPDTFVEHVKRKLDLLHMWWSGRLPAEEATKWTPTLRRISYYPAIVFLTKGDVAEPCVIWSEQGEIRREQSRRLFTDRPTDPTG